MTGSLIERVRERLASESGPHLHAVHAAVGHYYRFGADDAIVLGSDAGQALAGLQRLGDSCADRRQIGTATQERGDRDELLQLTPPCYHGRFVPQRLHEQPVVGHASSLRTRCAVDSVGYRWSPREFPCRTAHACGIARPTRPNRRCLRASGRPPRQIRPEVVP